MSNAQNDIIWETACERAVAEGVDEAALCEMDIEDVAQYLKTGVLPDNYEWILYRMYKT